MEQLVRVFPAVLFGNQVAGDGGDAGERRARKPSVYLKVSPLALAR